MDRHNRIPGLKHYDNDSQTTYLNTYKLAPQHPCRLLIAGNTGTGKTNIVMNLILQYLSYDKFYLFAKYIRYIDTKNADRGDRFKF